MLKKKNKVSILTGKKDRRELHFSRFVKTAIYRGVGCMVASLLLGFFLAGADMTNPITLLESIKNGDLDFSKFPGSLLIGFMASIISITYAYMDYLKMRNSRVDEEYGSAKLLTAKDMPKFNLEFFWNPEIVKKYEPNIKTHYDEDNLKEVCDETPKKQETWNDCFLNTQIMGQDVYLSMNTKFINRNLNTLTIGGSGQGKSYSELFPNTLNANSNYIFTDPSGEILQKTGKFLESQGYKLKIFNVDEFNLSMAYNPIAYVQSERDYNILVDALVENINMGKQSKGNDFFEKAAKSLDCALIALLKEIYPSERKNITPNRIKEIREEFDEYGKQPNLNKSDEEIISIAVEKNKEMQTFSNVMNLLRMAKQEQDEDGKVSSTLGEMFEKLKEHNPRSFAVKMWENFQVGGPKVCNEVIISSAADFGRYFDNPDIAWLTRKDELNLLDLASEEKCALFLIIPQSTKSYNFLCSMVYSQLFELATRAGKKWRDDHGLDDPKLPRHLSFWLDEFANIGKIPHFLELLSTIRKYNISCNIIIQGMSQLKSLYPQSEWETVLSNLDTMIYLGGMEPSTVKWLSEKLGQETIKSHSYNLNSKSAGESYQNMARNLLTPGEIEQMSRSCELVFITACKPIQTKKYNLSKHPNYKYSGEADSKNNLNINERFKDNVVDLDYLDEYALIDNDMKNFDFSMLHKTTIKRKDKQKTPSNDNKKHNVDLEDIHNGILKEELENIVDDPSLSDEDKQKRLIELEKLSKENNNDELLRNIAEGHVCGQLNSEFYGSNLEYEFDSITDFDLSDFPGLMDSVDD